MTTVDKITLTVSLFSLSISIFVAYKSYRLGQHQLRTNTRNRFQPLLIDVNRQMIQHPELWAFYDSHPVPRDWLNNPIEKARLDAVALMLVNVFECVFGFYGGSARLTKTEQQAFEAWKDFLRDTLKQSSVAREIWNRPNIKQVYNASLVAEINAFIKCIAANDSITSSERQEQIAVIRDE